MPSNHTTIGAFSLEHKERCDIITDKSGIFWLRYRAPSGSGKYIGFGLRIETGAERATIVDVFDIIQKVRDTGFHLKVNGEHGGSKANLRAMVPH